MSLCFTICNICSLLSSLTIDICKQAFVIKIRNHFNKTFTHLVIFSNSFVLIHFEFCFVIYAYSFYTVFIKQIKIKQNSFDKIKENIQKYSIYLHNTTLVVERYFPLNRGTKHVKS